MKWITDLENASTKNGGKAYGLSKLIKIGVPVPKGLVISDELIKKLLEGDNKAINQLSLFLNKLSNKLAVRSSAVAEDGKIKSFAGMFDTVLNVPNSLDDVLKAIKKVNRSVDKSNVTSYDRNNNLMNIVIQEMIDPYIAGVAFTEAINYDGKKVVLIEYVKGIGEKLVSGRVIPTKVTLNYDNNIIIPSDKKDINILIPLLQKIINGFKMPMDVEWCIDKNNKPYFVQARPITKKVSINNFLNKTNFWFKEFRTPLFYSTNPSNRIYQNDVILFFKSNSTYTYNLNDKEKRSALIGYKIFTDKNKFNDYKQEVKKIKEIINKIKQDYNDVNKLSNYRFKTCFFNFIKLLINVGNIYNKTEPYMLSKIEKDKEKNSFLIEEISKIRWGLRKEVESIYYFLYRVFLCEISRRYKINLNDLSFYTFMELKQLFNNKKVDEGIIKERKKGFVLICNNKEKLILTGKDFKILFKLITQDKGLVGDVVVPGNIKGIARVIVHNKGNLIKDNEAFKEGEILVTEMTRPDTIIACRKAKAILTDEGGLTSHAAIISRELEIPCIVGVRNATNVIKNGDLIEIKDGHIYICDKK